MNYEEKTQLYATWGDKYLQHTDVLYSIQYEDTFKPINVQLCLCEICDSDCPFCSVAARPLKSYIPWEKLTKMLVDFKEMGAKALEITGGGNPLLYRDREAKKTSMMLFDLRVFWVMILALSPILKSWNVT
jgi:2-iminoacetate synthase ThiH